MKEKSFLLVDGLFLLAILISVGFGVFLSTKRVTDPFLYYDVAFVKSQNQQRRMQIPESGRFASLGPVSGRELLIIQFSNMMGINPEVLQYFPIGALLVSITLFCVTAHFTKSPLIAILVTLYLNLNLSHATALYSVFAYALALPLYLGLMMISARLFKRNNQLEILIALILFIGVHFLHYTLAAWLILLLFGANLAIWAQKGLAQKTTANKAIPVQFLFLSFVVIYFAFNQIFYESFLPMISVETLDGALQRFASYASFTSAQHSPYYFVRSSSAGLITSLTLLVILLPIAVGVLYDIWQLLYKRSNTHIKSTQLPIILGIFVMGIVDSLSYSMRGSISTKSFSIVFPVLTLLYVQRMGKRAITYGVAFLLMLTSMIKIVVFYNDTYIIGAGDIKSSIEDIQPSAKWLNDHLTRQRYSMLSDLNLYGKYMVTSIGAKDGLGSREPIVQGFTLERYQNLIGSAGASWEHPPDIIAIDLNSKEPVMGFVWERLNPLRNYLHEILNNPGVNLIYDDGSVWLAKPREN